MDTESADTTFPDSGIQVGFGSIAGRIERTTIVHDFYGEGFPLRGQPDLDLFEILALPVGHDVESQLFDNQIDLKNQVGRPLLRVPEPLYGGRNRTQFIDTGFDLQGQLPAKRCLLFRSKFMQEKTGDCAFSQTS